VLLEETGDLVDRRLTDRFLIDGETELVSQEILDGRMVDAVADLVLCFVHD
jgi:hypothetical protein